jgi:hypothetical protein
MEMRLRDSGVAGAHAVLRHSRPYLDQHLSACLGGRVGVGRVQGRAVHKKEAR